jgi:hypothetical protein
MEGCFVSGLGLYSLASSAEQESVPKEKSLKIVQSSLSYADAGEHHRQLSRITFSVEVTLTQSADSSGFWNLIRLWTAVDGAADKIVGQEKIIIAKHSRRGSFTITLNCLTDEQLDAEAPEAIERSRQSAEFFFEAKGSGVQSDPVKIACLARGENEIERQALQWPVTATSQGLSRKPAI